MCENYAHSRPWNTERGWGWCDGCKSWQELNAFGRLDEHEAADPVHRGCCYCGAAYRYMSYTQPPCDLCARKIDAAEALRNGASALDIESMFGQDGVELAAYVQTESQGSEEDDFV
jgi:hypothetical protein